MNREAEINPNITRSARFVTESEIKISEIIQRQILVDICITFNARTAGSRIFLNHMVLIEAHKKNLYEVIFVIIQFLTQFAEH